MVSVPQEFLTKFEISYVPGVLNVAVKIAEPQVAGLFVGVEFPNVPEEMV